MSLSIGIDCGRARWKICLVESGHTVECCAFIDTSSLLNYVEHTCALFPEPTIVVCTGIEAPFTRLNEMTFSQNGIRPGGPTDELLIAIGSLNLHSYGVPSVKYLPSVPPYRKVMRASLGTARDVCAAAALLSHLREREAAWTEVRLLCLEVGRNGKSVLVIEDGWIVNGIDGGEAVRSADCEQAYWEGLTQEIAGLMAIHHFEDIVVLGQLKDAFIERFAESYQVYLFPYGQPGLDGYEAAMGAAIIAEGLYGHGPASEVVERLQIREASDDTRGLPLFISYGAE